MKKKIIDLYNNQFLWVLIIEIVMYHCICNKIDLFNTKNEDDSEGE